MTSRHTISGQEAAKLQTPIEPSQQIAIKERREEGKCLLFRMVISVFQYFEFFIPKFACYVCLFRNTKNSKILENFQKNVTCVGELPMNKSHAKFKVHISGFNASRVQ